MDKYEITECNNCGYETKCKKVIPRRYENKEEVYLCEVCRENYHVNKTIEYPSNTRDFDDVINAIAWGINYLRDEISQKLKPL